MGAEGAGLFQGKGLGAHWETGATSGAMARMQEVGTVTAVSFLHPPQSPEQYSDTPGWLEQQTGERGPRFLD